MSHCSIKEGKLILGNFINTPWKCCFSLFFQLNIYITLPPETVFIINISESMG